MKLPHKEDSPSVGKEAGRSIVDTLRFVALAWLMFITGATRIEAYTFWSPVSVWPDGTIPMDLQLGSSGVALMDGSTSWKTVAGRALAAWNPYIHTVQFTVYTQSPGLARAGDGINQAFFDSTVYGQSFGSGVLAVTTRWRIGSTCTEADTVFNSAVPWNSYRGNLVQAASGGTLNDFQRVAEHEFGHTLGLDHPDQAGQTVVALMNSTISDLDQLAADDKSGISALYPGVPPWIATQPQSQSITVGSSATFSVVAYGSPAPSYQWYTNGTAVPGLTASSFSFSSVKPAYAGTISVLVFNSHGSVWSQGAVLTVIVPPSITVQPQSQAVTLSNSVTFSVTAAGSAPFSYQWRFNGANLLGATGSSINIPNVLTNFAGKYDVVVINQAGSVTSAAAVLTVNVPPSITAQPKSQAVIAGKTATLSVGASGTAPLSYQWYRNSTPLAGATSSSFTIANAQPSDAGDYTATVSNIAGSANSAAATLTVQYAPVITLQPQGQNLTVGQSVTLAAAASGVPAPTYLWKFNGANIPGATSNAYTLGSFQPANAGSYAVVASNSLGSVTSSNAVLAAAVCVPVPSGLVGWWPAEGDATDVTGENPGVLMNGATFAAGKVGQAFSFDGIASYVQVPDNPSLHCTNGLTIEAWIYPTNIGAYYNVLTKWDVGNPNQAAYTAGMVPDGRVGLAVSASGAGSGPGATTMSTNAIPPNQWTHFAATYDGAALRTYVNGICQDVVAYNQGIFPGTSDLAIGSAGVDSSGQVVSPFAGLIDEPAIYNRALSASEIAALYNASSAGKCPLPPFVLTQPANQTVPVGDNVTFTVVAGGSRPLTYQWRFNGANIPEATAASYTISNVQTNQAGSYSVLVSNQSSAVTSTPALLAVNAPLPITAPLGFVIAVQQGINCNGNGIVTDSFDSANPTESTNGRYDPTKASTNGNIASLAGVAVLQGDVKGGLFLGPNATYVFTNNGMISGGVQTDFNYAFPDVLVPITTWLPPNSTNAVVGSNTFQYMFGPGFNNASGDYALTGLKNTSIYVNNATVRLLLEGNASPNYIEVAGSGSTAGSLTIYMDGTSFALAGACLVDSGNAASVRYYGTTNNTQLLFGGNASFSGTIYAPEADFSLGGGGSSPYDFIGACVISSLTLNGHYAFHFDENLEPLGLCSPQIVAQPQDQNVAFGQDAMFNVSAAGVVSYQWLFNGTNIPGATGSSLIITNVTTGNAGRYSVVIASPFGIETSRDANLALSNVTIGPISINLTTVSFAFPTQVGPTYVVEYKVNLSDPSWQELSRISGTGRVFTITDNLLTSTSKFYRVRLQ